MKGFFYIVILLDSLIILSSLFVSSPYYLLNTQLAFISSLLVVLGSFYGYKKVVQSKAGGEVHKDAIDNIEDRFDLYDEENTDDAKELFERMRQKSKRNGGIKNFFTTARGFFSPYRLFGYGFLVVSVLILAKNGYLEIGSFLLGLTIVPVGAMLYALWPQKRS